MQVTWRDEENEWHALIEWTRVHWMIIKHMCNLKSYNGRD